jgi:hypothetical protein
LPYLEAIDCLSSDRKLYQEGIAGGETISCVFMVGKEEDVRTKPTKVVDLGRPITLQM